MPLYDCQCERCEKVDERQISLSDLGQVIDCECGGHMKRLITGTRFQLPFNDPAYPTAYDRWATRHEKKATGRKTHL